MKRELPLTLELLDGSVAVDPAELIRRSGATDEDVVVLSGTLLEGIGNICSDLDLYVISRELPTRRSVGAASMVSREDGRVRRVNQALVDSILLDVQYYTFRELETLANSLRTLYTESRQSTRIYRKSLHHEDEDLIHKLLTGRILQDGTETFDAHATFDAGSFRFLKFRNEVGGYAEFRDLIGSWASGDLDTCLYNTRGYLISQVSGMMFLAGNTNPRPKWFIRRLGSLPIDFADVREGVMSWMGSAHSNELQKRQAVESACDLIDLAYRHIQQLLGTHPAYFTAAEAVSLIEHEFGDRPARDRDSMAEWRLRRRIYARPAERLMTELEGQLLPTPGFGAMHAAPP